MNQRTRINGWMWIVGCCCWFSSAVLDWMRASDGREREREIIYLRVITQRLHLLLRFVPRQLGCVFYLLELLSELKTRDTERERDVEKAAMIHDNTSWNVITQRSFGRKRSQLSGDSEDLTVRYSPKSVWLLHFLPLMFKSYTATLIYVLWALLTSRDAAGMFPLTLASCCSEEKPSPNTVLALLSAHWPNFCDVLVNVMLGVMVLLMITCWHKTTIMLEVTLLNQCRCGDFQWSSAAWIWETFLVQPRRTRAGAPAAASTRWTVL